MSGVVHAEKDYLRANSVGGGGGGGDPRLEGTPLLDGECELVTAAAHIGNGHAKLSRRQSHAQVNQLATGEFTVSSQY